MNEINNKYFLTQLHSGPEILNNFYLFCVLYREEDDLEMFELTQSKANILYGQINSYEIGQNKFKSTDLFKNHKSPGDKCVHSMSTLTDMSCFILMPLESDKDHINVKYSSNFMAGQTIEFKIFFHRL